MPKSLICAMRGCQLGSSMVRQHLILHTLEDKLLSTWYLRSVIWPVDEKLVNWSSMETHLFPEMSYLFRTVVVGDPFFFFFFFLVLSEQ